MTDVLDWLAYPELFPWLLPLIALIALLESLFVVGLLLPGAALLGTTSWLAGQQAMSLPLLLTAGICGAIAGDAISYYLGRHWASRINPLPLLQRHAHWQQQGEAFFQRYGAVSLLLGRFVGPIRPFIPFVAGSLQMPVRTFWWVNTLSALLWAPIYLLPGYWLGTQSELLEAQADLLPLLAGLALTLLIGLGLHHQLQPDRPLQLRLSRLPAPTGASLMALAASFGLLLISLLRSLVPELQGELALHQSITSHSTALYPVMVLITSLGDLPLAALILVLISTALALGQHYRTTLVFVALLLGTVLINHLLKLHFLWPRPDTGFALYESWSFPSGHASTGATVFTLLAILLAEQLTEGLRRLLYLLCALPVLLIALSRVVLDLHWPLDVVAGICEGLIAAALWRHWLARNPAGFRGLERLGLGFALILTMAGYLFWRYPQAALFYAAG